MSKLLQLAEAEDTQNHEDYGEIFQEAADDVEFEADDGEEGDENLNSSSDEDEDEGAQDEDQGERELKKAERTTSNKRKRDSHNLLHTSMKRAQAKLAPRIVQALSPNSMADATARPRKKSERVSWLPVEEEGPKRASSRQLSVQNKRAVHERLKEKEKHRLRTVAIMKAAEMRKEASRPKILTQAERLAEAAYTERMNSKSLNRWETAERKRAEEQAARLAALKNRKLEGPIISYWSGPSLWVNGKLKGVGKSSLVEAINESKVETSQENIPPPDSVSNSAVSQPASIPPQPESIPPQPVTIPPQPASTTSQPASIPPQPASTPSLPASIPPESTSILPESTSTPPESTSIPPKSISIPPESISIPPESISIPSESTTIPSESTSITPQLASTPPQPASVTPQPTSAPSQSTSVPSQSTSAPSQSTSVPSEPATTLQPLLEAATHIPPALVTATNGYSQPAPASITNGYSQQPAATTTNGHTSLDAAAPRGPASFINELQFYANLPPAQQSPASHLPPPKPHREVAARTLIELSSFEPELKPKDKDAYMHYLCDWPVAPPKKPTPAKKTICAVTGQSARYCDPVTGLPYSDSSALKVLRRLMGAGFQWSPLLGAYCGPIYKEGDTATGLTRPAAGVPMGFRNKKKARADKAEKVEKLKLKEKEKEKEDAAAASAAKESAPETKTEPQPTPAV
jgi:vacuolar protein sorting-associated protein 72